jgi:hypothetical protein
MNTEDIRKIINLIESAYNVEEPITEAAPKLTKNSPPEAHFHRGMREWHKQKASEARQAGDKNKYGLHKEMAQYHHDIYRKANGA